LNGRRPAIEWTLAIGVPFLTTIAWFTL